PAAAALAAVGLRALQRLDDPWFGARGLFVPAAVAFSSGDLLRSARLLGAADGLRETVGAHLLPFERQGPGWLRRSLEERLGDRFAAAWAEGNAMSLRRALDLALEEVAPAPAPDPAPPAAAPAAAPPPPAVRVAAEPVPDLRVLAL